MKTHLNTRVFVFPLRFDDLKHVLDVGGVGGPILRVCKRVLCVVVVLTFCLATV